jgi:hypothetical protein
MSYKKNGMKSKKKEMNLQRAMAEYMFYAMAFYG